MVLTQSKEEVFLLVEEYGAIFTRKHFSGTQQLEEILRSKSDHSQTKIQGNIPNKLSDVSEVPEWHLLDVVVAAFGL